MAEAAGVEELKVRPGEAAPRFDPARSPSPERVKEIVRVVPGELSFRAERAGGLSVRVRVGENGPPIEAVELLLRAAVASDRLPVLRGVD